MPHFSSPLARGAALALAGVAALTLGAALGLLLWRPEAVPPPSPREAIVLEQGARLVPVAFSELDGWAQDDHDAAFAAFLRSCRRLAARAPELRAGTPASGDLAAACAAALAEAPRDREGARAFFEAHFTPYRVETDSGGLLTAYYEPEVPASLHKTDAFAAPLHALPADLVRYSAASAPSGAPKGLTAARRLADGRLAPYPTRGEIDAGALDGRGLELAYVRDATEAYFIHIQGSARLSLPDGTRRRIAYAGKNGHPYRSIGQAMLEDGALAREGASAGGQKAAMRADPARARGYMALNPSYVFFRFLEDSDPDLGPVGGEGVQLTAGRSLAVDRSIHAYGTPFWIEAELPMAGDGGEAPFRRLMIAQDTGAAIKGPARGDLFWGTGEEAGRIAGRIKSPGRFVLLRAKPGTPGSAT
jgi:membrane-bound lytic murein transglycosylase A